MHSWATSSLPQLCPLHRSLIIDGVMLTAVKLVVIERVSLLIAVHLLLLALLDNRLCWPCSSHRHQVVIVGHQGLAQD